MLCATVLMRAQEFERSLSALSQAHDLLEPAVHGWQLALHDLIVAWNLALLGRLDDAEPAAHSSVERFDAQGEVWLPVDSLSILALIGEAQGDLGGASAAYEALLERSRAAGQRGYVLFSLLHLAALRGRQGDDAAADGLYEEAIACSFNPSVSADAMVGQAAAVRRLGDLARARALLDAAGSYYRDLDLLPASTAVLAGLVWWAAAATTPFESCHCRSVRLAAVALRGNIGQSLLGVRIKSAVAQCETSRRFGHREDDLISGLAVSRYDAVLRHSMRQRLERIRIDANLILSVEHEQLLGCLEFNALIDFRYEEQV